MYTYKRNFNTDLGRLHVQHIVHRHLQLVHLDRSNPQHSHLYTWQVHHILEGRMDHTVEIASLLGTEGFELLRKENSVPRLTHKTPLFNLRQ